MKIDELTLLVAKVCPIDGMNSNGVIFYKPSATDAERTLAQSLVAAHLPTLEKMSFM
jgi:hypothetical protein